MTSSEPTDEPMTAPDPSLARFAVTPPQRYELASRLDRARAFTALFDEPVEPVRIGRFVLLEYIGGGGMGEIYAARDQQLDRQVAIKLVRSDRFASPRADERLLREAQILARLSHPNVVQVHDAGRFEGRVFIAMELIRGQSLRLWLKQHDKLGRRARQREVLRLFAAAGRGLQAAHAAGLVHRDFKPDNVIVGQDGRPRVVDFGLARAIVEPAVLDGVVHAGTTVSLDEVDTLPATGSDAGRGPAALRAAQRMTTQGKLLGTPHYMAPEQFRGGLADHRSDQFSFCVALYEALYGQMPFAGADVEELRESVEQGGLREPPRGSKAPALVRRALERGLSPDPKARFSDMGALLTALQGWKRRRQRLLVALALTGAIGVGAVMNEIVSRPCADAGAAVTELWTPERRASIGRAFANTGLSYAEASWSTLEPQIDHYAAQLANEMTDACEATHERHVQSTELLDLRMLCLTSRQRLLKALLNELERADESAVERAHAAAAALPDLAMCQQVETLRHGMRPPARELEAAVMSVRELLARARTLEHFGKSDDALRIARKQIERAQAVAYAPLHAEAQYQTGRILVYRGTAEERAEGEQLLLEAVKIAEVSRHDELVAEIWNFLVLSTDRNHSSTERAREWHERAIVAIERIENPPFHRADALRNLGLIYLKEGEYALAEQQQRNALELLPSESSGSLVRAVCLHDLGNTVQWRGKYDEAQQLYAQALELHVAELGETHPRVANVRFSIAMLHIARGDRARARDLLDEVLRVHTETLGEHHPLVGRSLLELADIDRQDGALARARALATRGLAIYERAYGKDHAKLSFAHARLGAIEYRRGAYDLALAAYEAALALDVRHLGASHLSAGVSQMNVAEALVALGRHDEALRALEQAERVVQPHFDDDPSLAPFLASVRGRALLDAGRIAAAVDALESAVQGLRALPGEAMLVERADAYWALVQALSARGSAIGPEMRALASEALEIYDRQGPEARTPKQAVQSWLETSR